MTIIERIDNAATRAQLAAMGTLRDAAQRLQGPRDDTSARGTRDPEEGATTIAAAGFAGLLIVILKSDAVRAALESVIQEALNTR